MTTDSHGNLHDGAGQFAGRVQGPADTSTFPAPPPGITGFSRVDELQVGHLVMHEGRVSRITAVDTTWEDDRTRIELDGDMSTRTIYRNDDLLERYFPDVDDPFDSRKVQGHENQQHLRAVSARVAASDEPYYTLGMSVIEYADGGSRELGEAIFHRLLTPETDTRQAQLWAASEADDRYPGQFTQYTARRDTAAGPFDIRITPGDDVSYDADGYNWSARSTNTNLAFSGWAESCEEAQRQAVETVDVEPMREYLEQD